MYNQLINPVKHILSLSEFCAGLQHEHGQIEDSMLTSGHEGYEACENQGHDDWRELNDRVVVCVRKDSGPAALTLHRHVCDITDPRNACNGTEPSCFVNTRI